MMTHVVVNTENDPHWLMCLNAQLVELFGKDLEVWPCWVGSGS